ncbi:carboxymuconolactone decarboxylase family protein [Ereboglobus luteus]|uniref:carboxymuconolactone decarboxylase family protein n=1 Tax=Ereboglobus luteus TaxID=1796921 RepID=UPI001F1CFC2C|nr:carboxymuconolactone decarboxylase family protein [Ereboglobus luteus]
MKRTSRVKSLALGVALGALGLAGITKAQTMQNDATHLDARQRSIAEVAALTARGDLEKLSPALAKGLDAGLTINELKEVLVQMYAYTGFPRSLNGLQTLITVTETRRQSGIADKTGKDASPCPPAWTGTNTARQPVRDSPENHPRPRHPARRHSRRSSTRFSRSTCSRTSSRATSWACKAAKLPPWPRSAHWAAWIRNCSFTSAPA